MIFNNWKRAASIGWLAFLGMLALNVDGVVVYAEIKHDSLAAALSMMLIIPAFISAIAFAATDILAEPKAGALPEEP